MYGWGLTGTGLTGAGIGTLWMCARPCQTENVLPTTQVPRVTPHSPRDWDGEWALHPLCKHHSPFMSPMQQGR